MNFLSDLVAVLLGGMLLVAGIAYTTAEPATKTYCQVATTNDIDRIGCITRITIRNF